MPANPARKSTPRVLKGPPRGARKRQVKRQVVEQKIARAVELRLQGHSEYEIAERTGYSQPSVSKYLRAYFNELHQTTIQNLDGLRAQELARLEAVFIPHFRNRAHPKSAAVCIAISAQRAKLYGLDAPTKFNVNQMNLGPTGAQIDISKLNDEELQWLERIMLKAGPLSDSSVVATQDATPVDPATLPVLRT